MIYKISSHVFPNSNFDFSSCIFLCICWAREHVKCEQREKNGKKEKNIKKRKETLSAKMSHGKIIYRFRYGSKMSYAFPPQQRECENVRARKTVLSFGWNIMREGQNDLWERFKNEFHFSHALWLTPLLSCAVSVCSIMLISCARYLSLALLISHLTQFSLCVSLGTLKIIWAEITVKLIGFLSFHVLVLLSSWYFFSTSKLFLFSSSLSLAILFLGRLSNTLSHVPLSYSLRE